MKKIITSILEWLQVRKDRQLDRSISEFKAWVILYGWADEWINVEHYKVFYDSLVKGEIGAFTGFKFIGGIKNEN